ncbi:MAG: glycosyltransferase family 4 protein [Candidatus Riflebacteria bacterium]|nr:glycosyltransferase family 4 protein [Candidatus Riflebacteria bacterium]
MKILFVNEKCGFFGGVEQNVFDCARALKKRGHQTFLVFSSLSGRDELTFKSVFDSLFAFPEVFEKTNLSKNDNFFSWVMEKKPDVIYLHKIQTIRNFIALSRYFPLVRMIHDHDLCCPRKHKYYFHNGKICENKAGLRCFFDLAFIEKGPRGICFKSLKRHFAEMRRNQRISTLIAGSNWMADELAQNGFKAEKIRIVHPIVDIGPPVSVEASSHCEKSCQQDSDNQFSCKNVAGLKDQPENNAVPSPLKSNDLGEGSDFSLRDSSEATILYVGQLIRGKGVDIFLDALSRLNCTWRTSIVGDGNARASLEKQVRRLGLQGRISFSGWVDHEQLRNFYDSADIVVVPSRWPEPFGMVGLESMRYQKPVVAFSVGGIPDWLENEKNGILVPPANPELFALALKKLIKNPDLRRQMGLNGRKILSEKFSFEKYISRIEAILFDVSCRVALNMKQRIP